MSPVHSYTRSSFLDLVISRVRAFARIGPRAGVGAAARARTRAAGSAVAAAGAFHTV